jgi:hypothetical protein
MTPETEVTGYLGLQHNFVKFFWGAVTDLAYLAYHRDSFLKAIQLFSNLDGCNWIYSWMIIVKIVLLFSYFFLTDIIGTQAHFSNI